ncbi:hypothetical protein KEM56_001227 [Ascosphaera pollenicola]|nr:hypothetical protein KEM56_001227 [Ascosphaera pollenicola]
MMNQYIFRGAFAQSAFICLCASTIALGRYMDLDLGMKLIDMLSYCKEQVDDPWTEIVGTALCNSFLDHMRRPIAQLLSSLESSLEAAYLTSDHIAIMYNTLSMAHARLCLGHDMAELDAMMTLIPGRSDRHSNHRRNMVYILTLRQFARSMQGKTFTDFPEHIFSDHDHDSVVYYQDLQSDGAFTQALGIYRSTQIVPLFLYGYLEEAMKVGYEMIEHIPFAFTIRINVTTHFYFAMTLLVYHLENPDLPTFNEHMQQVRQSKAVVDWFRAACDTNYGMWSMILDGLLHEAAGDIAIAMRYLESALDHVQSNGFALEEALILELQADSLLRGGAKSAAQALVLRSISSWNRIGGSGKAKQLYDKHQWLLHMSPPYRTNDVACQTVDSLLNNPTRAASQAIETSTLYRQVEEERKASNDSDDAGSFVAAKEKSSPVELDVIDHYNILEVSQIISSQLEIGKLLPKMVNIILESCSGSDLAVVITEFGQDNWCVSACADRENGVRTFQDGAETGEFDSKIALNITHYTLRTREQVLVSNVQDDERFGNVSPAYANKYPEGKSIIALPIVQADKLLGAIHIEGKPHTFTQRNFTVLRLICNQIGISLANAFLFAEANRVSAANAAMVEAQKLALAHAREAEQKAKFAEAKARRSVKLKEDAAKAKSIFLANISHDLRTPMNGVIGLSELLKETQLDRQQDGYVESIRVCADTLLTLINDILDFSKLEAGKMKISAVPINLRGSIAEVVRALRYTHRDRGLQTIEDLEKIDPNLVVVSDPVRLHQIFMNLLSNSYKFTPKGSITVRAEAEETPEGKVVVTCVVADTGIGIGQEQMARLFRPFSQADSSTERSYGGSGLGLSICKAIIENVLGGKISLQSEPGVGTTVTFELVFSKAVIGTQAQISWTRDLAADPRPVLMGSIVPELRFIPRSEIRVCIAEDNPINQKIAVTFVRNLGLNSEAFSNGQEAVDALRARSKDGKPFHLVLMDVQMPVLDGYNATRLIREDEDPNVNNVLVIAMTASAIEGDKEKCIDAGMNNYLAKPVRSDVLKAMLDNYLAPPERDRPKRPALRRPATAPTAQEVQSGQAQAQDKQLNTSGMPSRHPSTSSRNSLSNGEAMALCTLARAQEDSSRYNEEAMASQRDSLLDHDAGSGLQIHESTNSYSDPPPYKDGSAIPGDENHRN